MSYKKNIASNFITQIFVSVIAFLTSIIVARTLGPEGRGYVAYPILIFTLIGEYGNLGILKASIYFQKRTNYSEEEVFNTNQTFVLLNFVIISLAVILVRASGLLLTNYSWQLIVCGILMILFIFLNSGMTSFYIGNERIVEINKYNIIMNLTKSLLLALMWVLGMLDVNKYIIIYSASFGILTILLYSKLGIKYKFTRNRTLIREEFKFGLAIYLATLFIYLNYRMDQLFIRNMLNETQMGIYTIAVALAELLFLIPGSVGTAILGRLYNIDNSSDKERKRITSLTVKYTFYICAVIGVIGIMMTPLIPLVYGKGFAGAKIPTMILFIGIIFASIGKVSSSYFQSIGNTKTHLIITAMTFVMNLILNVTLIPIYGITGAAIASTGSYITYGIAYIVFFIKLEGFSFDDFFKFSEDDILAIKKSISQFKKR